MTATIAAIGWTLIDFLWQGAVIGVLTAGLLLLMRRASPNQRYLVGCAALLACIAWPAFTLFERLVAPDTASGLQLARGSTLADSAPFSMGALVNAHLTSIVLCWAACSAALGLRMSLGLLWIGRFGAASGKADAALQQQLANLARKMGIARAVCIRIVDNLASPVTAGWLRPVVLVPASLVTGMPPDLLEALLAHELAHVKRMDYLVNLGQNVIETLFFYHPAVWWISKQVRDEREKIADDLAAHGLGEPRRLALALSELEKIQFSRRHLAMSANGGDLMSRIKRLLRPEPQASSWKAALPVMALALVALASQFPQAVHADNPAFIPDKRALIDFRSCAKPQYPAESIRQQHTGAVSIEFDLDAEGMVAGSRVIRSSGHPLLDEAAQTALEKCRFSPATKYGSPVSSAALVQYVWVLE